MSLQVLLRHEMQSEKSSLSNRSAHLKTYQLTKHCTAVCNTLTEGFQNWKSTKAAIIYQYSFFLCNFCNSNIDKLENIYLNKNYTPYSCRNTDKPDW